MIYCIRLATTFRNRPISLQIFGPRNPGDLFSRPPTNNTSANSGQPNFESTSSQPEDICCRMDARTHGSASSDRPLTNQPLTAHSTRPPWTGHSRTGSLRLDRLDRPPWLGPLGSALSDWRSQIGPHGPAPKQRQTRIGPPDSASTDRPAQTGLSQIGFPWIGSPWIGSPWIGPPGSAGSDHPLTHSPTHPFIHSFTRSFICIYSPIYLSIY